MKSKKLIIFQDKKSHSFFLRATTTNAKGKFVITLHKFGKALPKHTNDAELGRWVRRVLEKCT